MNYFLEMTKDQTARNEKLKDLMDLMARAEVDGVLMPAEDRKRLSRLLTDPMPDHMMWIVLLAFTWLTILSFLATSLQG